MKTTALLSILLSATQIGAMVLDNALDSSVELQRPILGTDEITRVVDIPLRCSEMRCKTCRATNKCESEQSW
jgi:hypothetical protein